MSLTTLETRMQEKRIQVILHKQENFAWPVAETDTRWIIVGLDKDLNVRHSFGSTQRHQIPCDAGQAMLTIRAAARRKHNLVFTAQSNDGDLPPQ